MLPHCSNPLLLLSVLRVPPEIGTGGGRGGSSPTEASSEDTHERRLIDKVRRGGLEGSEAMGLLAQRHQRWLVNLLYSLLGNMADAEDVGQDVFIRAFLGIHQYRGESGFKPWLRRIAINTAFTHRRRRERIQQRELSSDHVRTLEAMDSRKDGRLDALTARDAIQKILLALPYPYAEILVLFHVEELSLEEITVQLDIGLSAAKMRLKRAREHFAAVYREYTKSPDDASG